MGKYKQLKTLGEYVNRIFQYGTEVGGIGLIALAISDKSSNLKLLLSGAGLYIGGRVYGRILDKMKRSDERLEQKMQSNQEMKGE